MIIWLVFCGAAVAEEADSTRTVLFYGDSLTAGYGIDREQAFPALIQARIDSLGWDFEVFNAGLSGETSAGGLRRIDWILRQKVDVFALELGANDGLRGIDLKDTRANLQGIVDRVKAKYPDVVLVVVGMQMPPNLGPEYTAEFKGLYSSLAEQNGAALIPFLLAGVGDRPELNLPDGNHPTVAGHKVVAENVWAVLGPLLEQMR
ncbi:MAG: arylesterase [Gemmatimonadetes bacterium]|nr:arylesterase [Gemmatimonadota bacterium]